MSTGYKSYKRSSGNHTIFIALTLFLTVAAILVLLLCGQLHNLEATENGAVAKIAADIKNPMRRSIAFHARSARAVDVGSVVTFGRYEQDGYTTDGVEDLEWIVLKTERDRALIISRYIIERMDYYCDTGWDDPGWDDSSVRRWLNGSFLVTAFSNQEQNEINTVIVTNDVFDSRDKIFLLNSSEAQRYFKSNSARKTQPVLACYYNDTWDPDRDWEWDDYDMYSDEGRDCWILRPDGYYSECAAYVDGNGEIGEVYGNGFAAFINGIRPAMWVNISAIS